ncbi:shuttle craft [Anopheles darlingi]|uniref:Shuttle craft n=1 Tax=Anopheles darlingi TaxID=43151 RepID=W5JVC9_ANODA|nr:shuttle craft [Anopheles darlingi]
MAANSDANSGVGRTSGGSGGGGSSFDEFISQFNARVQIQQSLQQLPCFQPSPAAPPSSSSSSSAASAYQYCGMTSNLTPTAAEFVPRKYQQSGTTSASFEQSTNGGPSEEDNRADYPSTSYYSSGGRLAGGGGSGRTRRNESLKPRNGWHIRDDRPVGRGKWKQNQAMQHQHQHQHQQHQQAGSGRLRGGNGVYGDGDEMETLEDVVAPNRRNIGVGRQRNHHHQQQQQQQHHHSHGQEQEAGRTRKLPVGSKQATEDNGGYTPLSKCSQREKLMREIECYRLECLVCCEVVKPTKPVWSCGSCYHILHLACVTRWATSSQADDGSWRCPACQHVSKEIPRDYLCFCGKLKNPTYNHSDLAHSCGEVCGRRELCGHPCTLLCHPGPCPSCQATVQRKCGCGRVEKSMQCSLKEDLVCEATCDKPLNCGLHRCDKRCHPGACEECKERVQHRCYCERNERSVACTEENRLVVRYGCEESCSKVLGCGNHQCQRLCHGGNCEPCADAPEHVLSCPCGRQPVEPGSRTSCLDPIPTCTAICGRKLKCGPPGANHGCEATCHKGNCPPCKKSTTVKCRCGNMDQPMKCKELTTRADDARCKKRCTRRRNCAKHKCNQLCCIDIDHICPKTCSLPLSCGRHRCDKPCHKGNCQPCHRVSFDELTCDCGANVIYPPVPCGTRKPACDRPCPRRHACEHAPLHNCHSETDCPPCVVLTTKYCYGKHEQRRTIPCYQESFSCGMPCARPLACGRHKCIRACHEDVCMAEGTVCKQSCVIERESCAHPCNAPCHEGECPDVPCRVSVEVTCECGNRKQQRTCHEFSKEYRRIASMQLASSVQEMQRGGSVELSDILAPKGRPKNNKTLECSEECRMLERNRRLAMALQIRNPDLPSKLQPNYSEFLRTYAKKDMALVQMIHEKLTELVKLAKESKQKSRSHSFPVMNREKRRVVHEMCHMFGVESVAYDAEPNRNIVATADRFTSWLPSMSLMEVLQRENGQRRIIVPNLNAWGRTSLNASTSSK